MKREIITTADGSSTILVPDWQETYHSKHGAVNESLHVFIKNGFEYFIENHAPKALCILEIGFGTGLNALLTLQAAEKYKVPMYYETVEGFPMTLEEIQLLNYAEITHTDPKLFQKLHDCEWEETVEISDFFSLHKRKLLFENIVGNSDFDLIYFDAFGARVQPHLWTLSVFKIMYTCLRQKGVLVTYASKGSARRAMIEAGFSVEKLPGPPGKREMLRASVL
ncbi:MAG TPA: tRNA (5-methylaminomethyl-2-thiouridine)(34)-methyltransferase MnmD [Flavobacteriaceae bacterium]|nr:tRNA (5-methylaminomethyl-2-thiouridine)(34)-methyltransferase MnmD [Flavobacteriaceae bacterium]